MTTFRSATISEDGKYRYDLSRWWTEPERLALWVMLNPSTADASVDDPTIRRCIAFTRAWGLDGLVVVNQFSLRATDPDVLRHTEEPLETFEGREIKRGWMSSPRVDIRIAAWGAGIEKVDQRRYNMRFGNAYRLHCLGTTKAGHPRHPLYVKGDTQLQLYPA